MCRDLTRKVEAVKPDPVETDRFRTEESCSQLDLRTLCANLPV